MTFDNLIPYAPEDHPEYLILLKPGWKPPNSKEGQLRHQIRLLEELVRQSNSGEINHGNNKLRDGLQEEELVNLPLKLLDDPRTPAILLSMPAALNYLLADWKAEMPEMFALPPMSQQEANQEATDLSLESFMSRIV